MTEGETLLADVLLGRCPTFVLADWLCERVSESTIYSPVRLVVPDPEAKTGKVALAFVPQQGRSPHLILYRGNSLLADGCWERAVDVAKILDQLQPKRQLRALFPQRQRTFRERLMRWLRRQKRKHK